MRTLDSWLVPGVILAVAVVAAGGAAAVFLQGGLADEPPPDAERLEQRVRDRTAALESYRVTVNSTIRFGNETERSRVRLYYEDGWANISWLAPSEHADQYLVTNGTTSWSYNQTSGDVRRYRRTDPVTANVFARSTRQMLEDVNLSYAGTERVPGESTVKVSYQQYGENVSLSLGNLGGEKAARLDAEDEGRVTVTTTVWVDPERELLRKIRRTATDGEHTLTIVVRFENVTTGVDVPDHRFEIPEPSTGGNVSSSRVTTYRSAGAYRRNETARMPDPELPDGFAFELVFVSTEDGNTSTSFIWSNNVSSISLTRSIGDPGHVYDDARNVTIGNRTFSVADRHDRTVVTWHCEGTRYVLTARTDRFLSRDQLFDVAASIECHESGRGTG